MSFNYTTQRRNNTTKALKYVRKRNNTRHIKKTKQKTNKNNATTHEPHHKKKPNKRVDNEQYRSEIPTLPHRRYKQRLEKRKIQKVAPLFPHKSNITA